MKTSNGHIAPLFRNVFGTVGRAVNLRNISSTIKNRAAYAVLIMALTVACAAPSAKQTVGREIPHMPIKASYENSLEYLWSKKEVHKSRLLSDMETLDGWEHHGFGDLTRSDEKPYKGKYALRLTSPTKGTDTPGNGRPWGTSSATYKVNNENWTDWNRLSFWIYPELPGFKVVSASVVFHNDGEEKVPDIYQRNGLNYHVLENQKWNKVYCEIAHLGRDKVTGVEIRYRMQGNEPGATQTVQYFIDELYLEKVEPDYFEGWEVAPKAIAYNHAGYAADYPKIAFMSNTDAKTFVLRNAEGQICKEGAVQSQTTPVGTFQVMDFSDINTAGQYVLEAGALKTKPFAINRFSEVYRSSIIKTINHFYTQRCGFAVEGIHDACHLDWLCHHNEQSVAIHGGWHDAGDLSQGLVNTSEATYAMLLLYEKLKPVDTVLANRLLEEAKWGLDWMLKTRFGNGFRNSWATKDMWTDGINGTSDDYSSYAINHPYDNLISATTEAMASVMLRDKDKFLADYALACAIDDYHHGALGADHPHMHVELAGATLNATLALYRATNDKKCKEIALRYAKYIADCQQQTPLDDNVALKGFFYGTPKKEHILHYSHRGHEQDAVVGLVKCAELFPAEASELKKTLQLYADYYKEIMAMNAPYYMIPAGIYDLSKAGNNETVKQQIVGGVKLNERYYLKHFPVWTEFRGNSGTTLTQAKGLAVVARYLNDKELLNMVYRMFDWHLGANPFAQSLMYGEGYRYAGQYSVASGNLVGGLPVGVQTHFDRDTPYWSAENCYNWKEIWVHPSCRWLMLVCDFI